MRPRFNWQALITLAVLLAVGFLVLLPVVFLVEELLNIGDPMAFPPEQYGIANYIAMFDEDLQVLTNTVIIAVVATVMAILIGFTLAWILTRTNVPGREKLERLMELPYYMTPLVGALAWAVLASPKSGFFNQIWHWAGGTRRPVQHLFDVRHRLGHGAVRGHGRLRHDLGVDEVDGPRARGIGARHRRLQAAHGAHRHPAAGDAGRAGRHAVRVRRDAGLVRRRPGDRHSRPRLRHHHGDLGFDARAIRPTTAARRPWGCRCSSSCSACSPSIAGSSGRGSYATITGKAFRPRPMDMGRLAWLLFGVCALYIFLAVVLPIAALILTSFQRFATVLLHQAQFTLANYETALSLGPVREALVNSLMLGFGVATVGVVVMALLVWIIYRSQLVGRGAIEYLVMFPQAVPRLVFGLALLWAWLNMPIPIYGTLWLLALAYFTVMLPLGVRTLAGVVLQIDKSLEECARVCGAGWVYQMRTVTLPLLKPGILAAWLLIFMACVRELGASVFLMGPNAKVIAPSIVNAFATSGTELTAAMALIQTFTVIVALVILFRLTRGMTRELT